MSGTDDKYEEADSFTHYRSPSYSPEEVECLLELIEKHRVPILNPLTNSKANHAKDQAWDKVTNAFNSRGIKLHRTKEMLQNKWDQLKRSARKSSKNLMDVDIDDTDHLRRILALMCAPKDDSLDACQDVDNNTDEDDNQKTNETSLNTHKADKADGSNEYERRLPRSLNFAPKECRILCECVEKEKNIIFSKINDKKTLWMKDKAWIRVAKEFNSRNDVIRPVRVLRNKLENMRRGLKRGQVRAKWLGGILDMTPTEIKTEPPNIEVEIENNDDFNSNEETAENDNSSLNGKAHDPLESVLNSTESFMPWDPPDNERVVKLKMELLNVQIENAKLEKQRLLKATEFEAKNQESIAIRNSLKLRAARLQAAAAEKALPEGHPALTYCNGEELALDYLMS